MAALFYLFVIGWIILIGLVVVFFLFRFASKKKSGPASIAIKVLAAVIGVGILLGSWKIILVNYEMMYGDGAGKNIEKSFIDKEVILERISSCSYSSMSDFDFARDQNYKAVGYLRFHKKMPTGLSVLEIFIPKRYDFTRIDGYHEFIREIENQHDLTGCKIWYSPNAFLDNVELPGPEKAIRYQQYLDSISDR